MKSYLLNGKWINFKVEKCPNCSIGWLTRMFYDTDISSEIQTETNGFEIINNIIKEQNLFVRTYKCSKCDFKIEEKRKFLDEQETSIFFKKMNKDLENSEISTNINSVVISKSMTGLNLNNEENIQELIKELENKL